MDYERYLELFCTIPTIEAPDEQIPEYDPYDEEQYMVDCFLADEALMGGYISHLLSKEGRL